MTDKEELLSRLNSRSPFNSHNGISVTDIGENYAEATGKLTPESLNPWGTAHGAFIYALCDVAAGVAAANMATRSCVTLSAGISYLRPSEGAYLRAEGRVLKTGHSVAFVQTDVYDDKGRQTARGEFQFYMTDGR